MSVWIDVTVRRSWDQCPASLSVWRLHILPMLLGVHINWLDYPPIDVNMRAHV